jgi:two-component system, OmpR family, phosphate regulon response regulator PhoB
MFHGRRRIATRPRHRRSFVGTIVLLAPIRAERSELSAAFRQYGHSVRIEHGVESALLPDAAAPPGLLVACADPEGATPSAICRRLQGEPASSRPRLLVIGGGDEIERVVAFELGADDYVCRPYSAREVALRARVILQYETRAVPSPSSIINVTGIRVDPEAHRAWADGHEIAFSRTEFRILVALYRARGRVQSRDALVRSLWSTEDEILPRTVDAHIKRVRERLGSARTYIETVRGVGYRFRAP